MRSFKTLDTEAREAIKERIFLGIKDKLKKTTTYSYQTKLSILWILGLTDDLSTHTQRSLSQSFRKNVFQFNQFFTYKKWLWIFARLSENTYRNMYLHYLLIYDMLSADSNHILNWINRAIRIFGEHISIGPSNVINF